MTHNFTLDENGCLKEEDLQELINTHELYIEWGEYPDYDHNTFYIFDSWSDVEKLVQIVNNHDRIRKYGDIRIDSKGIYIGLTNNKTSPPYTTPENELNIDQITGDILYSAWGFSDEHTLCTECYNIIRTSPDSYSWIPDFWLNDSEIICGNCIRTNEDIETNYIDHLINNYQSANTILTNSLLETHNFKKCHCGKNGKLCEFLTRFHGTWEDPEYLLNTAIKNNPTKEFIFEITNQCQFETEFTLWSREKEDSE